MHLFYILIYFSYFDIFFIFIYYYSCIENIKDKSLVTKKMTVIHTRTFVNYYFFQYRVIYFLYSECKCSNTVYYIDFTLLFATLRRLKEIAF